MAPAPSVSALCRSSSFVSATAISSSLTVTTWSTSSSMTSKVFSPMRRVAMPSAMVSTLSRSYISPRRSD